MLSIFTINEPLLAYWLNGYLHEIALHRRQLPAHTQQRLSGGTGASFYFLHRGDVQLLLRSKVLRASAPALIHLPPGKISQWHVGRQEAELTIISYQCDPVNHAEALSENTGQQPPPSFALPIEQAAPFYQLLELLTAAHALPDLAARLEERMLLHQWCLLVVKEQRLHSEHARGSHPVKRVIAALTFMHQHYDTAITLDSLAANIGCSPGHLSNLFKQILGRSPIECLIYLRMSKARNLLRQTDLPLRMIAQYTGYQDAYYFSKAFKKYTGLAPSAYRKHPALWQQEDIPSHTGENNIVPDMSPWYTHTGNNNHYQLESGDYAMKWKHYASIPMGLLVAFGILIAGCADNSPANEPSTQAEQPDTTAGNNETANDTQQADEQVSTTRTVTTIHGEIEVPAQPQRIITDYYAGYLLALDVTPIGSLGLYLQSPYLVDKIAGITDIGEDLETIIALEPDLIIAGNENSYEAYSKIAPTVLVPHALSVQEKMALIGEALDKEAGYEKWVANFDEQATDARNRAHAVLKEGETVTVFAGGIAKQQTIYGAGFTGYTIYEVLALPMQSGAAELTAGEQKWGTISSEVLGDYAGEHVFVAVDLANESFDYASDPIWRTIAAVQHNQLYEIDGWRFWFSDPISLSGQANDIATMLEERAAENTNP